MSAVQPPGSPVPFRNPWLAKAPFGFGQVVADDGMNESTANGAFVNTFGGEEVGAAWKPVVQPDENSARLTSFCSRHVYGAPAWETCVVCAASAFARPFTPSQPP